MVPQGCAEDGGPLRSTNSRGRLALLPHTYVGISAWLGPVCWYSSTATPPVFVRVAFLREAFVGGGLRQRSVMFARREHA